MNTIGQLFHRVVATTGAVLLALVIALPLSASVSAQTGGALTYQSDDFNRCTLNTSVWTIENPAGAPAPRITGQYTAQTNAVLTINVPAGAEYTFSNTNKNAPRIMQDASDQDFQVEARFSSPLGQPPLGAWNIQGILFRDTTSVPGQTRWLRFDLNSSNSGVHYYIGYVDENGTLHKIAGPSTISSSQFTANPLYLRIRYEKALNRWSIGYSLGESTTIPYRFNFLETGTFETLPTGFTFNVDSAGVFAGSTGDNPPGFESRVDYFRDLETTGFVDDAFNLNVATSGSGTVDRSCSGTTVTLTANPASGASFNAWTGDLTGTSRTLSLPMTRSYSVTANFSGAPNVDLDNFLFMPITRR